MRTQNELTRYENARRALAEAHRVDEAKGIRDMAVAAQVYAKQAKDRQLIQHATEIRLRAERRAGELLAQMEKNKGARQQGIGRRGKNAVDPNDRVPRLSDLSITKDQSSRWQKLAALPAREFENKVTRATDTAVAVIDAPPRRKPKKRKSRLNGKPSDAEMSVVETCVRSVKSALLAALSALDPRSSKERRDLFDQVETAIRAVRAEAAGADHLDQTVASDERWSQQ
jgi:hypothetical protein